MWAIIYFQTKVKQEGKYAPRCGDGREKKQKQSNLKKNYDFLFNKRKKKRVSMFQAVAVLGEKSLSKIHKLDSL